VLFASLQRRAEQDAGASGATFPRWSVGTINLYALCG